MKENFVLITSYPISARERLIEGIFSALEEGMSKGEEVDSLKDANSLIIFQQRGIIKDLIPQIFDEIKKNREEWKERRSIFFAFKQERINWPMFEYSLNQPLYFSLPENHKKGEFNPLVTNVQLSTYYSWLAKLHLRGVLRPFLEMKEERHSVDFENFEDIAMEILYVGTFAKVPFSKNLAEYDVFFAFQGAFAHKLIHDEIHHVGKQTLHGVGRQKLHYSGGNSFRRKQSVRCKPDIL